MIRLDSIPVRDCLSCGAHVSTGLRQAHGGEREAQLRVWMGNLAGESWSDLVTRLKRYWTDAGCDPERLKEAVTHYRDDAGPKIRPARGAWGGSDLPVARSLVSDNTILILFL